MSLPKYLKILSSLLPAGAAGVSLLLGSAAPSAAHEESPASTAQTAPVSERLAAIRDAVSVVADSENATPGQSTERQPMVAWWNGWYAWPNWNNWRNWPNWNNWGNYWRNW